MATNTAPAFGSATTGGGKYLTKQDSLAPVALQKGLYNKPGENNCFLNSAIQVLWHVAVFRRSLRKFKGHYCNGPQCICCATTALFKEFQYSKESALPPDQLRIAMAICFESQNKFQLGLMDDAAECFEKILERLHCNLTGDLDPDTCDRPHCITHQKFAMNILEHTWCRCGETSEPFSYTELVHYVSAAAVIAESEKNKKMPFAQLLKQAASLDDQRQCPNYRNCKQVLSLRKTLMNSPDVVAIGLIWDSDTPPVPRIKQVVERLGLSLKLSLLYDHTLSEGVEDREYHLQSVVTYYGRHYSAFSYHRTRREWVYFDDAMVKNVGSDWYSVKTKFYKAHYQPLLLVYTWDGGREVDTSQAPKDIVPIQAIENTPPEEDLISFNSLKALQESIKEVQNHSRVLPAILDAGLSNETNTTGSTHITTAGSDPDPEQSINLMSFESIKYSSLTTPQTMPHPQQDRVLPQAPNGPTHNSTAPTSWENWLTHPLPSAPVNQQLLTDAMKPTQYQRPSAPVYHPPSHPWQRTPYPQQQLPGQPMPYPNQPIPYPRQQNQHQQYPWQHQPQQQYPRQPAIYPGQQIHNHSPQPSHQLRHPSQQVHSHSPQPSQQTHSPSPQPSRQTHSPSLQPSRQTHSHSPQPSRQTHTHSPQPSRQSHSPSPQPSRQTHSPSPQPSQTNQSHSPQPLPENWMTFSSDFSQTTDQQNIPHSKPRKPRPQPREPRPQPREQHPQTKLLPPDLTRNSTTTKGKQSRTQSSGGIGRSLKEIMDTWKEAEAKEHSDEVVSVLLYKKTLRLIDTILADPALDEPTKPGLIRLRRDANVKVDQLTKCTICQRRIRVSNSNKCRPCQLRSMISLKKSNPTVV